MFRDVSRFDFFSHDRFVEDLRGTIAMSAEGRKGATHPLPMAQLSRLGADILHATALDHGAHRLKMRPEIMGDLLHRPLVSVFSGEVILNVGVCAAILGRSDLAPKFQTEAGMDWERGLQWFVFYGLAEHGLYHLVDDGLRISLRKIARSSPLKAMSPLQILLQRENPSLGREIEGRGPNGFLEWLIGRGWRDYSLFWALMPKEAAVAQGGMEIAADPSAAGGTISNSWSAADLPNIDDTYPFVSFSASGGGQKMVLEGTIERSSDVEGVNVLSSSVEILMPGSDRNKIASIVAIDKPVAADPPRYWFGAGPTACPAQAFQSGSRLFVWAWRSPEPIAGGAGKRTISLHTRDTKMPIGRLLSAWAV